MIYVCGYVFKCSIACNSKTLETTEIDATLKKGRYTFIHTLTENWLLNVGCDFLKKTNMYVYLHVNRHTYRKKLKKYTPKYCVCGSMCVCVCVGWAVLKF